MEIFCYQLQLHPFPAPLSAWPNPCLWWRSHCLLSCSISPIVVAFSIAQPTSCTEFAPCAQFPPCTLATDSLHSVCCHMHRPAMFLQYSFSTEETETKISVSNNQARAVRAGNPAWASPALWVPNSAAFGALLGSFVLCCQHHTDVHGHSLADHFVPLWALC